MLSCFSLIYWLEACDYHTEDNRFIDLITATRAYERSVSSEIAAERSTIFFVNPVPFPLYDPPLTLHRFP